MPRPRPQLDGERQPTVREEMAVIKTDIGWLKRAVLGLYALVGTVGVAAIVALAKPEPVQRAAQAVAQLFT